MFVAVGVGVGGLIACWRATGALLAGAIRRFEAPVWIGIRIFCLSIGWRFWPDGAGYVGKVAGTAPFGKINLTGVAFAFSGCAILAVCGGLGG
jgi:hypothetical protein